METLPVLLFIALTMSTLCVGQNQGPGGLSCPIPSFRNYKKYMDKNLFCCPRRWFQGCCPSPFACLARANSGKSSPQDYLNAHNAARAQVGVGPMTWDETVAGFAQRYVNTRIGDCKFVNSGNLQYGENLANGNGDFTGVMAVKLWLKEKSYYDYSSNKCAPGRDCGHYTQVVRRASVRLGCARARCVNNGWWYVACHYAPPGNYGQRPY